MRVTDEPGRLVVDLCDDQGSVVVITADGWQVADVREVPGSPWFRRGAQMLPQAVPQSPGDVLAAATSICVRASRYGASGPGHMRWISMSAARWSGKSALRSLSC